MKVPSSLAISGAAWLHRAPVAHGDYLYLLEDRSASFARGAITIAVLDEVLPWATSLKGRWLL